MNQSTTMVPKFREYVKGNESCYAETHLYEVLIHDVGFYIYSWMYYCHAHGGHDVETCTNIVHVLDIYLVTCTNIITASFHIVTQPSTQLQKKKGEQIDLYAFYAVGWGYFQEVHLSRIISSSWPHSCGHRSMFHWDIKCLRKMKHKLDIIV